MAGKKVAVDGFDDMGQAVDAPKSEASAEAVKELQEQPPEEMPKQPNIETGDAEWDKLAEALRDPSFRKKVGMDIGEGLPLGEYERDYDNEEALKVYGGVEVKHGPNVVPDPPSYIPKYVTDTGGTTDHVEPQYTPDKKLKYEGAKKDRVGNPLKTEHYKMFLDKKMAGDRLSGEVRFDIASETQRMLEEGRGGGLQSA